MAHGRPRRDIEQLRNLRIVQSLDRAKQKTCSRRLPQRHQCPLDAVVKRVHRRRRFHPERRRREFASDGRCRFRPANHAGRKRSATAAFLPGHVQRHISNHLAHPCCKTRPLPELIQLPQRDHGRILHGVFRQGLVTQDPQRNQPEYPKGLGELRGEFSLRGVGGRSLRI